MCSSLKENGSFRSHPPCGCLWLGYDAYIANCQLLMRCFVARWPGNWISLSNCVHACVQASAFDWCRCLMNSHGLDLWFFTPFAASPFVHSVSPEQFMSQFWFVCEIHRQCWNNLVKYRWNEIIIFVYDKASGKKTRLAGPHSMDIRVSLRVRVCYTHFWSPRIFIHLGLDAYHIASAESRFAALAVLLLLISSVINCARQ